MKLSTKIILPIILISALLILLAGCFTAPPSTYTVTYDGNGNTGGTVPVDTNLYEEGASVTVLGNTGNLGKTGFDFAGWNTATDGTGTNQTEGFTMGAADVILYARWTEIPPPPPTPPPPPKPPVHNITRGIYYNTIQAALNDAESGNIIEAANGTYNESITFPLDKVITLRSVNGASFTTITGGNDSATVTCSNSPEYTTIEGFTITHNSGYTGRGITITDGYLNINSSIISGNTANSATDYDGGGIHNGSGTLAITGGTISGNTAAEYGGGIYNYYGTLTITNCTISVNTAADSGGGIHNDHGTATIIGGTISSNSATDYYGGGIYNEATLTITGSEISGNSAPDGGGIYNWSGDLAIIDGTIFGNTATNSDGGGIYNGISDLIITGSSIISGNSAAGYGGGICIYDNSPTPSIQTIQNNTISGNTASVSGGGIYIESGSPTIGGADGSDTANFNTICGNTPDQVNPDSYPNNYISTNCYIIGDTGPAGGLIFYINPNYVSDGWRYLEAAPASTEGTCKQWGKCGTEVGITAQGINVGTGKANTTAIVAKLNEAPADSDRAAQLCDALTEGGYSDWFLPSKDELNLMYTNLKVAGIGGFVESDTYCTYWSSSEYDAVEAWYQDFYNGDQSHYYDKNSCKLFRAIRAF